MKKILTILWMIIIAGSIFTAMHLIEPKKAGDELDQEIIEEIQSLENKTTEVIIEKTSAIDTSTSTKTFTEYINLGDNYLDKEYITNAIENYENAYYLSNYSEEAITKLAKAYLLNNQAQEANTLLTTANKNLPDSEEIIFLLAKSHINTYNLESAQNLIWQLVENYPKNYEYLFYKALILTIGKDYEGSQELFEFISSTQETIDLELIENSEKFLETYEDFDYYTEAETIFLDLKLAKILTEIEKHEASIPLLYEIIEEKNDYRDAWIVLGYAYLNTMQIAESIDALEQARTITSNQPETLFFLGLAYYANNEIDKAIYYIEESEEAGFESQEQIDLRLGELYLIKEEYEKSAAKYESLLSKNKNNIKIYIRTVWLYIDKLDKPQKALKIAKDANKYYPEEAMSYNLLGWAYLSQNNIEKAKENLELALKIDPDFDAANLNFGILYEKQGLFVLAKEYYKSAYTLGNGNTISQMAANKFNELTEEEAQQYYKANISQP